MVLISWHKRTAPAKFSLPPIRNSEHIAFVAAASDSIPVAVASTSTSARLLLHSSVSAKASTFASASAHLT